MKGFGKANIGLVSRHQVASGPMADALKEMERIMAEACKVTDVRHMSETRVMDLHPSSFPFCPIYHAIATLESGLVMEREEEVVGGGFYTSIGTAVHETFQHAVSLTPFAMGDTARRNAKVLDTATKKKLSRQKFMKGLKRAIVGDYYCKKCKHNHEFSPHPGKCVKCGHKFFRYEELAVRYGKNITGHTDGLLWLDGKYYVIDYKTTSSYKVMKHQKEGGVFPAKANVPQIKSYIVLLEMMHNIVIEGWMLIYITRDNFHRRVIVGDILPDKEKRQLRKLMAEYELGWELWRDLLKVRSKSALLTTFDKIEKLRPCHCKADHDEIMKNDYFSCPLAEDDLCFSKRGLTKTMLIAASSGNLIKVRNL
ncbi:CRISPR/Cas system associated protein [Pseudomonas phage vB_PpuM-SKa-4]